ncbi:MAG: hypothetical protein E7598_02895 [Ruminococcaceae bacterium]|nr:hypothetical protein [Oscillospiraceae bacterium]
MRKAIIKPAIYLLTVYIVFSVFPIFSSAQNETSELSVMSANVAGLPAFLSKYDRDVPKSQEALGKMLNESGYDIICVQEDFGYHSALASQMTNYQYQTYTSGGVPIGDGLNIFSKYPFYNVMRVTWKDSNGYFTDGMDALAPKGFIKCTVDVGGVLIDLYNVHNDAYRTNADQLAKKSQLIQLTEYIEVNSKDRPIIITGDTNLTFHNDPLADMYRILIEENGFTDTWVEMKNGGNYFQGEDAKALIDTWYNKFGGHDWGRWDSVERVIYKNGDGLKFKPSHFEYEVYSNNPDDKKALTDHRMMECIIEIDVSKYEKPTDITLNEVKKPSFFPKLFHDMIMLLRFIWFLLLGLLQLIFSNIYSTILLVSTIILVIYLLIKKTYTKKGR